MSWLARFERELADHRIPRRTRRRILLEFDDHLRCDPDAEVRLGDPAAVARTFADDLAAAASRRAALGSFAVLVFVGAAFSACLLMGATFVGPDITAAEILPLGLAAALGVLLAPQVALAAGVLALLGWVRTRAANELPAGEGALLRRRAAVGLLAGATALASLGLYAFEYRAALPSWWLTMTFAVSAGLLVPVLVAAAAVRRTASVRSNVQGDTGDVFDDLHIPSLRFPWLLCAAVAAVAALAVGVAGGPDDWLRNAVFETVAVIGGFTFVGRRLGLRA